MSKREQIIKKLEDYEPYAACFSNLTVESGLLLDVLQLLREQQEVPVKRCKTRPNARYPYSCGNCGSYLMSTWISCPMCGKGVKQDD